MSLVSSDEWAHKWSVGRIFSLSLRAREGQRWGREGGSTHRCPPETGSCRQLQRAGTRVNSDLGVRRTGPHLVASHVPPRCSPGCERAVPTPQFTPCGSVICGHRFDFQHYYRVSLYCFIQAWWKSVVLFKPTFKGNSPGSSGKIQPSTPVGSSGHYGYLVKLFHRPAERSTQLRGGEVMNPLPCYWQF